MSATRKPKDKAGLRVKLTEDEFRFVLEVSERPSPSDECLFYCIKCIEQSLDNVVGYNINISFEISHDFAVRYEKMAKKVCEVCEALTIMNPGLYDQLPDKLQSRLNTRQSICAAFRDVANVIFEDSVCWEKIIALFAFTGALVVECILQNNAEFVVVLLYSMKYFAENELTEWISQHDGWTGLFRNFQSLNFINSLKPKGFIQLLTGCFQENIFERTCDLACLLQEALLPSKYLKTAKNYFGKMKSKSDELCVK